MNGNLMAFFKKYDRSLILLLTAIFVGISTYVTLKATVERTEKEVFQQSFLLRSLQEAKAVQDEINRSYEKKLDKIEEKLDKIWQKIK